MKNLKGHHRLAFAVLMLAIMLFLPQYAVAERSAVSNALPENDSELLAQVFDGDNSSTSETTSFNDEKTDYDWDSDDQSSSPLKTIMSVVCGILAFLAIVVGIILIIVLIARKSGSGSSAPLFLGCGCCTIVFFAAVVALLFLLLFNNSGSGDDEEWYKPTDEWVESGNRDNSNTSVDGEVATDEYRDPNDPDYTPARYAINAAEEGGKWNTLESGETVYEYTVSGEYARSVWVNDGGTLYYVDASGCRMRNNYAHDGFYAGNDGQWDKSKKPIIDNAMFSERPYGDGSVTWVFNMDVAQNGTISGTATQKYSFGTVNTYRVTSFGHSAYRLIYTKDESMQAHVVVLNGGSRIAISCAGSTDTYDLQ